MRVQTTERVHALLTKADGGPLPDELAARIAETGALLEGHFLLQRGAHSPVFLRASQLLFRPENAATLAAIVAPTIPRDDIDVVLASEAAASFLAPPLAEQLGKDVAFSCIDGRRRPVAQLSKGNLCEGARVLLVADVVTTGRSLGTLAELVRKHGGVVRHVTALADLGAAGDLRPRSTVFRPQWSPVASTSCEACLRGEPLWPAYELA